MQKYGIILIGVLIFTIYSKKILATRFEVHALS